MKKIITFLAVIGAVTISRLLPFNWIVGSCGAVFSWSTMFAPVVAAHCGLIWVSCFLWSAKLLSVASIGSFLLHRMPLIFAARAFMKRDILFSVVVPVVCMVLFLSHKVGMFAWGYTLYWWIPVILYGASDTQWNRALTASFVAHAVGSVVWLYCGNIPAKLWWTLIPVVACERLLMAMGIVVCNTIVQGSINLVRKLVQKVSTHKATV